MHRHVSIYVLRVSHMLVHFLRCISVTTMCCIVAALMVTASCLQLSLVTATEWSTVCSHLQRSPRSKRRLPLQIFDKAPVAVFWRGSDMTLTAESAKYNCCLDSLGSVSTRNCIIPKPLHDKSKIE